MRAVIQRVSQCQISIGGKLTAQIGRGLLVLLAIYKDDAGIPEISCQK